MLYYIIIKISTMKMTKKSKHQLKVIGKKLQGDKVFYLTLRNKTRKWMDFEHMNDYLEEIMEYQKSQEEAKVQSSPSKPKSPQEPYSQKIEALRKSSNPPTSTNLNPNPTISNIVFLNRVGDELFFKVHHEGGFAEVLSGRVLRARHPQEMLSFYEKHVSIQEQTC